MWCVWLFVCVFLWWCLFSCCLAVLFSFFNAILPGCGGGTQESKSLRRELCLSCSPSPLRFLRSPSALGRGGQEAMKCVPSSLQMVCYMDDGWGETSRPVLCSQPLLRPDPPGPSCLLCTSLRCWLPLQRQARSSASCVHRDTVG